MLLLIGGRIINPTEIVDVGPIKTDNPNYIPEMKFSGGEVKANGEPPFFEKVELLYKTGDTRIIDMPFKEFHDLLEVEIKKSLK